MLEYIKSQIKSQRSEQVAKQETPADVSNEVIVEYAHLFQELAEDISENGTESGKTRKLGIDIPLDLDTEVSSIELNLDGALVEDVPGDATSITESYQTMKTYDKFYEEAVKSTTRFPRETEDAYDSRVTRIADKMYNEYCNEAAKIGDFFITVTGCTDVITEEDFAVMKDGAILSNAGHFDVEVDVAWLRANCVESMEMRKNIMGYKQKDGRWIFVLAEGRLVNLAAGDGHPAEIMDMSFAIQALSVKYLVENKDALTEKLIKVPAEVDQEVALRKLEFLGKNIDTLTQKQRDYLEKSSL